ncbi:hypothetical protein GDO86_013681 [Hymenochirus boettgeri]|uniref:Uncharacterized protein n=1 Tax=Hymenochirus boettgeri TaxID=247094 RepID=A0A8T2IWC0_9PIPI|nr:hypothetical protein GDO86_013681 [Hymenochirus boettgeri]
MFEKATSMDIRGNPTMEENSRICKPGHKDGKETRDPQNKIPSSYLKEQQQCSYPASGSAESCPKSKAVGSVDPDYCRRILVRDAKGSIREIILPKGLDLDHPKGPELPSLQSSCTGWRWSSRGVSMWLAERGQNWPNS